MTSSNPRPRRPPGMTREQEYRIEQRVEGCFLLAVVLAILVIMVPVMYLMFTSPL